ncbi:hypothetical protein ACWGQT_29360, partial [Streptomyces yangpuensis]
MGSSSPAHVAFSRAAPEVYGVWRSGSSDGAVGGGWWGGKSSRSQAGPAGQDTVPPRTDNARRA